jgi:hypothetical protein
MQDSKWKADIVNDPTRDFDLAIDLWEDDIHRATISRRVDGDVELKIHPCSGPVTIPGRWLAQILEGAEKDFAKP